ncbi:nicotinate-nucleotide adenylyltransferase [Lishizhenia tianjinensis]|uniref:Probable nicotinate-nucleotide adenylyltransferase n=1 Tax=Lishizhenia tianjinensis TaxID=477690 RepID=A0A1I6ZLZ1_9FLAO|nr:nicotinate (nicotinamide) nucleotide adenylyltransferase [Lishizhenia tianjinensis]SFT63642.1 nicotinate-nucleotide adenylyltransferase [Lishizhenia tianjinensis]
MKVGLYFGSFNPIHIGHLIIANHMVDTTDMDQVWMVVSPHNPLKKKKSLLEDYHRLALVNEAIEDNDNLRASDIEFKLEQPSYTANTLAYLKEKHPTHEFVLIMGEDNLRTFHKWKNYEQILERYEIYVYPRVLTVQELEKEKTEYNTLQDHPNVHFCADAPLMKISSSYIRKAIKNERDVRYLLPQPVLKYIDEMNFYKG